MAHISVRKLSLWYGKQQALRDISVDIPDGQITAIIGPSGCGKTTLLKSLNRLTDLYDDVRTEGAVLIDGENILDPRADVLALRQKLGYLPQRPYPLPMSIYDNVTFGPRIHGIKRNQILGRLEALMKHHQLDGFDFESARAVGRDTRATDLLVEFYLRLANLWDEVKDRLHTPAARLSIGQQQRLALARTLAVEPEAILADEPTSALDPISAQLVEKQLRLLKKNYSIIVVTHILRQARRIADHAIYLYLGELVEHGPAAEFFVAPKDPRTQAYISGEIS